MTGHPDCKHAQPACTTTTKKLVSSSRQRCFVLLDAAKFASTNRLDLRKHPADFVCLSFYKLFGYPTGLGMLLCGARIVTQSCFMCDLWSGLMSFICGRSIVIHVLRPLCVFSCTTTQGALLVKKSAAGVLRKCYFGGGTVEVHINIFCCCAS